uniref:Ig-like domain-containing protein n=1 Tax=Parastrongyloides trichosuri TaxID=131310 RepID=A0A0N5A2C5_PARTI
MSYTVYYGRVLVIDVNDITLDMGGIKIERVLPPGKQYKQWIGEKKSSTSYLKESTTLQCNFFSCEVGYVFIDEKISGQDIIQKGLKDVDLLIYIEYSTDSNVFIFGTIVLEDENFPLVICPTEEWLNQHGGVTYKQSYGDHGIYAKGLKYTHSLKALYPRHDVSDMFICGEIIYEKWNNLYIGYKILKKVEPKVKIDEVNLLTQKLTCVNNDREVDYYVYYYKKNDDGWREMNLRTTTNYYIHENNFIYLYHKKDKILKDIDDKGFDYTGETNLGRTKLRSTEIKPTCIKKVVTIPGSLQLFDNKKNMLTSPKNLTKGSYQIVYIKKEDLNRLKDFKCAVYIEEVDRKISRNKALSTFYENLFVGKFVRIDRNGNKLFIKKLQFDRTLQDFGKYNCTLEPKYGHKLNEKEKFIEKLGVIFVPSKDIDIIKQFSWKNYHEMELGCEKGLSNYAEIKDIIIDIHNENKRYQYSKEGNMFKKKDKLIVLDKSKLGGKGKNVKRVTTNCTYVVNNGDATFYILRNETVLAEENIIIKIEEDNPPNYNIIFMVIILILTLIIITIIIAITIYEKKKREMERGRRKNKGSSTTTTKIAETTKVKKSTVESKKNSIIKTLRLSSGGTMTT